MKLILHHLIKNVGRVKVAKMVIMRELPLRFVEYIGFREMISYHQPRFESIRKKYIEE